MDSMENISIYDDEQFIKERNKRYTKLTKAHNNNLTISDMRLKDKFTYFEDSKVHETESLLYEVTKKPTKFKRYSRGRIVRVQFGVNIGSEFSGDHFAIVVSKGDTMMSSTIHVIPITSKKHTKNIEIGNVLYYDDKISNLKKLLANTKNNKDARKLRKTINFYEKRKDIISYACIDHLKTISKISICKVLNEFDYLPNIKLSSELMKKIDEEIIKEYTI